MSVADPFVDTSALAKRYVNEAGSDRFDAYFSQQTGLTISRLVVVEFRCMLARRGRAGNFDDAEENAIYDMFVSDLISGQFTVQPIEDAYVRAALDLIVSLHDISLRTLDAIHLAVAQAADCRVIVTADRTMATAAREMGFEVVQFG